MFAGVAHWLVLQIFTVRNVIDSRLYQLVLFLWSLLNKIIIFYIYSFQEWMASLYASWLFLLFICYISCFNSLPGFVRGGTVSSVARWGSLTLTPRSLRGLIGAFSGIFATLCYFFVAGYSPMSRWVFILLIIHVRKQRSFE